jgi:hypothetical protein
VWVFVIVSVLVYNVTAFLIRKRLSGAEIYATVMFGLVAQLLSDSYASFGYKMWGFFDRDQSDLEALWVIFGMYPACTVLIINWYPYLARWWKKLLYLIAWACYSTFYEYLTMIFGVMWHDNGWSLYWSFLLYPFIYYMLIVQLRVYRWIMRHVPKPV